MSSIEHEASVLIQDAQPILALEGITLPSKAEVEKEAGEIALTWAGSFAATFVVMAKPALDAGDLHTGKAIIVSAAVAGCTAGVRAAKPLFLKAIRGLRKPSAAPVAPAAPAPYSVPAV